MMMMKAVFSFDFVLRPHEAFAGESISFTL